MKKLRFGRELGIILINRMLEKHGKTYLEVKDDPYWYNTYTWTAEEEQEYKAWFVDYLCHNVTPRVSRRQAEREYSHFIFGWGLTVKE